MSRKKDIHFEVSERKVLLRLFDIVSVCFGIYILTELFSFDYLTISQDNIVPLLVLTIYITVFGTIFEIYDLQKASKLDVTFRNIVLTASVTVLFYLLTPVLTPFLPEQRFQIFFFYLALIVSIFLWRVAYVTLISAPRFYKKVLLVGEISNIENIVKPLNQSDPNYKIVGFINCEEESESPIKFKGLKEFEPEQLLDVIQKEKISEVLVASYNSETIASEIYHDLINLLDQGFTIREHTQVYEEITYRVPIQFIGKDFYKYFPFSRSNQNKLYLFFHRTFDIFFAVVGLLIGITIMPFILIGNLIGNRGPLFYTQERVGKNGKPFKIVKLRSMIVNAEKDGAKWAQKNDKRITIFGNFLRRSRLDEIPQFINILRGDMSIIGPRPERPFFVNELSRIIPFYETRHIIKPGLTGWAQVKTRYGSSVDDSLTKLQYDLYYIKHRSIFLDLNIIVKTMSTILYYRGQ
ncbi:sugar transferase [Psychroserpens sp.]|uniref:sugar transferase n=1 Tax=Psychroserpens sp. TaxID=2020870 RepID=UPI001B0A7656|nr:sugar transferase [Psychroserpens sp.]MBO6606976.1 sugar transferase [Psychroserpens sp.]MBO6654122.1 sugar transferase [Psychroserpens sp.]MBO6682592.1 sugar transferase [Psychroserpens sp.]MBO6750748.1 sugar transferase [Psychroserpens sp.]MBO6915823.1 sugar transferase [Psychroserpens sp.]